MISWDIENFYLNFTTKRCIEAVETTLRNCSNYPEDRIQCICEALTITMSCNNGEIAGRHFTQIDGATIGGPESGSVMDIFGAEYIDKVAEKGGNFEPLDWKRYRDDTFDIEISELITDEEIKSFTTYLNANVHEGKIISEEEVKRDGLVFLDTKVRVKEGYLVPEIYSKPTDPHKYLNPSTEHPEHVSKGIPYSCSDRSVGDKIFIDKLVEYKGYLLDSGYNSQKIDKQFLKVAQIPRLLEGWQSKRQTRQEETGIKVNFVVSHDPTFPDIREAINRHYHILKGDEQCARLFPKGMFRVCSRRGNRNLKECIAPTRHVGPKRVDEQNRGNWKCGSCGKSVRGKKRELGIYNCDVMEEATNFRSKATKEN